MGVQVSAAEAATLVGRHERIVRGRIYAGDLPSARKGSHGWLIDTDDLARINGWTVDRDRLALLEGKQRRSPAGLLATVEALTAELRQAHEQLRMLERRIAALESGEHIPLVGAPLSAADDRQAARVYASGGTSPYALAPSDSAYGASGDDAPAYEPYEAYDLDHGDYRASLPPRERRPVPTLRLAASLPDGLVSAASFADLHRIPQSTMKKAMQSGRLPARAGRWKSGRAWVAHALDADGRAAFYALWGGSPGFARCAECPHT